MTCFWDGLISRLFSKDENINKYIRQKGLLNFSRPSQKEFVDILKQNVCFTSDVLWNNQNLSQKSMQENLDWIKDYDSSKIYQGHDCPTCDPFLLLVSQLFTIDIYHNYNESFIKYTNIHNTNGLILSFMSNTGHFW